PLRQRPWWFRTQTTDREESDIEACPGVTDRLSCSASIWSFETRLALTEQHVTEQKRAVTEFPLVFIRSAQGPTGCLPRSSAHVLKTRSRGPGLARPRR